MEIKATLLYYCEEVLEISIVKKKKIETVANDITYRLLITILESDAQSRRWPL